MPSQTVKYWRKSRFAKGAHQGDLISRRTAEKAV